MTQTSPRAPLTDADLDHWERVIVAYWQTRKPELEATAEDELAVAAMREGRAA